MSTKKPDLTTLFSNKDEVKEFKDLEDMINKKYWKMSRKDRIFLAYKKLLGVK